MSGLISGVFPIDADTDYDIVVGLAECSAQTAAPPCNATPLPARVSRRCLASTSRSWTRIFRPTSSTPGPQSSAEGAERDAADQASDAEGDAPDVRGRRPARRALTIDPATGVISGVGDSARPATYAVTVEVDDHVNTPLRSVTFAWTVTATNRPPVVHDSGSRANLEGDTLDAGASLAPFASDPEGSPLTFVSATGLPPGITMNRPGALSGTFSFTSAGVYTVTVRVSDGTHFTDAVFTGRFTTSTARRR